MVNVVDSIPLAWSTDGSNGDIDAVATDLNVGKDPTFFIIQLSDVELTNIETEWQICNTLSGICYEQGIETLDSSAFIAGHTFVTAPSSGNGLANFDEVKLHVTAIGTDGFDYESEIVSYLATEEGAVDPNGQTDGTNNATSNTNNTNNGNNEGAASEDGGMNGMVIVGVITLVVLLVVAGTLAAMLLRGGREEEEDISTVAWGTEPVMPAATTTVAAPAAAPVVNSVPDYTQLTPGGQYVTGHAGETVYLSPDGTAWTMQADSSFIRTS
jgi:hypothetical protein